MVRTSGGTPHLAGLNERVARLVATAGLSQVTQTFPSVDEAVWNLGDS